MAEYYPGNAIHTENMNFHADGKKDTSEKSNCSKNYPETSGISGGLGHLTCSHGITKGFTAIQKGESPALFAKVLMQRMPKRVKAHRRIIIYDNCCNFHKYCLRRFPFRIRRYLFVIDRHHLSNHKNCSQSYNMDNYRILDGVNSQVAEQRNRSLRKLSTTLAHYKFQNYLRILQLFFGY